jgi:hypothetical protein
MPTRIQSTTPQSTILTQKRLRQIVVWVLISMAVLLSLGIILSLLWPGKWNPLLVSLILNIISGLIGAAVAILTGIFVVQKFLDDRNREEEIKQAQYHATWTIVQYQLIKVEMYVIVHFCLFVAFGKDRYLQLANDDAQDMPESIGNFTYEFVRRLGYEMEKTPEVENDKEQSSQQSEQAWSRWKQAFISEVANKASCSIRDVDVLLDMLYGFKLHVQDFLYLIQPFMIDKMGMAYALADLSYQLRLTIDTVKQHMAAEIVKNPQGPLQLCEAVTSRIVSLGYRAVKVKEMISANKENDVTAVIDRFPYGPKA